MKTSIRQILDKKGYQIHTIAPDATVFDAIKLMCDKGIGALLVLENGKLVGIISERDYTRKVILQNRSSLTTPVKDIMTSKVLYLTPEQTIEDCMLLMSKHPIRHVPIMENDRPIGVLSSKDIMKNLISEKDFIIHQLELYISGSG
jgi:Predicted signal-transduction protein containing cAMP-binding and CBS domains